MRAKTEVIDPMGVPTAWWKADAELRISMMELWAFEALRNGRSPGHQIVKKAAPPSRILRPDQLAPSILLGPDGKPIARGAPA